MGTLGNTWQKKKKEKCWSDQNDEIVGWPDVHKWWVCFLAVNGCFRKFLEDCHLLMEYALHVTFWNFFVYSIWIASILFAFSLKKTSAWSLTLLCALIRKFPFLVWSPCCNSWGLNIYDEYISLCMKKGFTNCYQDNILIF